MPKIVLTDLTRRWGDFYAVDHLDLVIEDRAFVTLLGPSGCGKTTTLRMIAGLETPTAGRIEIGDRVVFDSEKGINIPANRRRVGFLFQNYALWQNMTVYQNIAFGLKGAREDGEKRTREEIDAIVRRVAKTVKIESFLHRYPGELSGGQQQRVAIARTLAPEPQVILMDEPLSNLDAKLRLEMRSELQRLHLATGCTFVYVTHDQMEAMTLATAICLMDNGILRQYAPPREVYRTPATLFAADFVGAPAINFAVADGNKTGSGDLALTVFKDRRATFSFAEKTDLDARLAAVAAEEQARRDANAARAREKGFVPRKNADEPFVCPLPRTDDAPEGDVPAGDFILGIRPEDLEITDGAGIPAEVYSVMPAGMETTVRVRVGTFLLTGVVFGDATWSIGSPVGIRFRGDGILLFHRASGRLLGTGSLSV